MAVGNTHTLLAELRTPAFGKTPSWGDTVNNATLAEQDFQGSFAMFQAHFNDTNLADYIGRQASDPANNDVWAVVNATTAISP